MPAPHIAFVSSAISSPSSSSQHDAIAFSSTAPTGPLPPLLPASLPITVSNAISSNSSSNSSAAYASAFSQNGPPESSVPLSRFVDWTDRTGATPATGSALPRTHHAHTHIITALASSPSTTTTTTTTTTTAGPLSATALPRTSSLLPPARVTAKTVPIRPGHLNGYSNSYSNIDSNDLQANNSTIIHRVLDAPATIVTAASPSQPVEPYAYPALLAAKLGAPLDDQVRYRPARSNSVNGTAAPDPARLHNHRWSTSTGSSRASIAGSRQLYHRHERSASFSRRLSIDSLGSSLHFAAEFEPSSSLQQAHPRILQKNRPGTLSNGGSPLREREPESTSIPPGSRQGAHSSRQSSPVRAVEPFATLPPIIALPSLEQEVQDGSSSFSPAASRMSIQPQQRPHLRQLSSKDNIQSFYFGDAPPPVASFTPTSTAVPSISTTRNPTMQYTRDHSEVVPASRAYSRNRSQAANGSTDSTRSTKDRPSKPPSQKAMLSRALQKANTAVQLDNAGNIEGAREAYAEACGLLQQVLFKTPGEEDRRKLEAIVRATDLPTLLFSMFIFPRRSVVTESGSSLFSNSCNA